MNSAPCLLPDHSLEQLSDSELLAATRSLVGRSNQLLAALLAHLGEVEARAIHRTRACSSLYTYCIHELRLSEDEAYRRVAASRLVRRFPALLETIAAGELHLTGLLMLGPHLTENNLSEVLRRAKHRTKKEVAALVRVLDPLPDVPARIEPLGPASARLTSGAPSWPAFVAALCPVRELGPGDRPRDWVSSDEDPVANRSCSERGPVANDAEDAEQMAGAPLGTAGAAWGTADAPLGTALAAEPLETPAPARVEPQRYRVEFTASQEYVELVEEAKALLAHRCPRIGLDEIHLRALRVLVAQLKKQKYAVTSQPRKSAPTELSGCAPTAAPSEPPQATQAERDTARQPLPPRQRERYVPAALRRAVFERDGGRCTYLSASGERCRETRGMELHHVRAYALGGEHSEANIVLRCRAHNWLAAEDDFGRDFVDQRRDSLAHEPFAGQRLGESGMPGARRGRGVRPVVGWVSIGWAPDGRGSYGPFNTERPSMPPFSPPHACFAGFCDQHAEQDPPARAGFLFVFSCLKRSRRELAYVHAMRRAARRLAVIRHLGTLGCGGERRFSSPIKPKRKCWLGAPAGGMVLRNSPKAGSRTLRKLAHSRSLVAVSSCELTFAPTAHHRATTSVS